MRASQLIKELRRIMKETDSDPEILVTEPIASCWALAEVRWLEILEGNKIIIRTVE